MDAVAELQHITTAESTTAESTTTESTATENAFVMVNDEHKGEQPDPTKLNVEEPVVEQKEEEPKDSKNEEPVVEQKEESKDSNETPNEEQGEPKESSDDEISENETSEDDSNDECNCQEEDDEECDSDEDPVTTDTVEYNVIRVHHRYEDFPPVMTSFMYILLVLHIIKALLMLFGEPINCPCFPMNR